MIRSQALSPHTLLQGFFGSVVLATLFCVQTAVAEPVCVISEKANLRKAPSGDAPISWVVAQFMPLNKIGQKGIWAQVQDLDGETHWVASSTISSRINCVVVKTKTAPLRQAANLRSPAAEIGFADRYTPFKKIDRDGGWIQLQDEYKSKFWVYETNVWIPVIRARVTF
jgi:SH3-like domain-containing protein